MQDNIARSFFIIGNKMRRYLDNQYLKFGLSASQARLLRYIHTKSESNDVFLKDVEEEFQIRGASGAELIDGLEKMDLINREELISDRRKKRLVITKMGQTLALKSLEVIQGFEAELQQSLSESEFNTLKDIMTKLDSVIDRKEKEHEENA